MSGQQFPFLFWWGGESTTFSIANYEGVGNYGEAKGEVTDSRQIWEEDPTSRTSISESVQDRQRK